MAEFHGRRIAAVLTADTNMELVVYRLTEFDSCFHELANACLVKLSERIVLEDLSIIVSVEELTSVIS